MVNLKRLVLAAAVIAMTSGQLRADIVLNFDSLTTPGDGFVMVDTPYAESGFVFSSSASEGFAFWETGNSNFAGSTALTNDLNHETTTLQRADGVAFDLKTIDMTFLFNADQQFAEDTFTGIRADSSIVTQRITFGPAFGFQTDSFTGFNDLVSVSWSDDSDPTQFDNIRVSGNAAVPEPSSLVLAGLGGLLIYGWRRRA
jgi:hypothetical protein